MKKLVPFFGIGIAVYSVVSFLFLFTHTPPITTNNNFGIIDDTCHSSSFPTKPEVPLFIKWENFLQKTRDLYFIQIGANVGKNVGSGDPIWEYVRPCHWNGAVIEPNPATYAKLKGNYHDLEDINRVVTLNLGVSHSPGYATVKGHGETASLGVIRKVKESDNVVEVVSLAQLWNRLKSHIPSTGVDILVIDAEGNEAKILCKGGELPHPKPSRILFEIAHLSLEVKDEIDETLRSQGYRQSADLIHRDDYALRHNLPAQDRLYELI